MICKCFYFLAVAVWKILFTSSSTLSPLRPRRSFHIPSFCFQPNFMVFLSPQTLHGVPTCLCPAHQCEDYANLPPTIGPRPSPISWSLPTSMHLANLPYDFPKRILSCSAWTLRTCHIASLGSSPIRTSPFPREFPIWAPFLFLCELHAHIPRSGLPSELRVAFISNILTRSEL